MGLDSFNSSNEDNDCKNETSTQEDEEETQDSGLESFRTSSDSGGSGQKPDLDGKDKTIHDVSSQKWNSMSVDEKVRHVRDNKIPDFRPEYQPDDRWAYRRCAVVRCVCGSVFTVINSNVCLECGRVYEDAGRTVVKKVDPHTEGQSTNE